MPRIAFVLTHNASSKEEDKMFPLPTPQPPSGTACRIFINEKKGTLWSLRCKWKPEAFFSLYFKAKLACWDLAAALYMDEGESCFVTEPLIGSQRNRASLCHRSRWHNSPLQTHFVLTLLRLINCLSSRQFTKTCCCFRICSNPYFIQNTKHM